MAKGTSLQWVLINSAPFHGQASGIPSFDDYQTVVLDRTLAYSKILQAKKVHLVMFDANDDADW